MRRWWRIWIAGAILAAAPAGVLAASCVTQAELTPQQRDELAAAGQEIAQAIVQQDFNTLHGAMLPALQGQWDGIRAAVAGGAPLVKGGQAQLRSLYLLDSSSVKAPADTEFFCSNATGSLTVTISMHALPPGKYAVVLADAIGAPLGGQMGIILVRDDSSTPAAWKLGGVTLRQGAIDGHDGVWYWQRARTQAASNEQWSAWYSYAMARYLLLPVDFISSPNLDKLNLEQSQIKDGPSNAFPMTVTSGERSWKVSSLQLDTTLREADLRVTYESLGIVDPAAMRTEAVAVLGAMLKARPELRNNFHGLWAYASKDGKLTPVIELPMAQIPQQTQ
ncbi:MAG TPA: hypothetical protein VFI20_00345 [Terracidiphilus sp.]|nr:hypothetical protein [Terracidiphilus sp.]